MGKKEPKAVKALIAKHERQRVERIAAEQRRRLIPAATLFDRLRRRRK